MFGFGTRKTKQRLKKKNTPSAKRRKAARDYLQYERDEREADRRIDAEARRKARLHYNK